jgi:SAM-dependent methyltransferase
MNKDNGPSAEDKSYQDYWEKNITEWGAFYLDISHGHERLNGPAWLNWVYKHTIVPIEAKLMAKRHEITTKFIRENVKPGVVFADLGCGTGIFVVEALMQGAAKVQAVDFTSSALEATKKLVEKFAPEKADLVQYYKLDLQADKHPVSDVSICVGVTPYMQNLEGFLGNAMSATKLMLCQFSAPDNWANRIRTLVPFLNVRKLIFHSRRNVDAVLAKLSSKTIHREDFATGYIDIIKKD